MNKHIAAVCGALAITGMTVTAQTPQPAPTQPQTPQPKAARPETPQSTRTAGDMMTVTGCVMAADASSSKAAADTKYVLSNVQHAAGTAKPAAGTAASHGAAASHQSFALKTDGTTVDLSKHLNHKVELTGTMDTMAQRSPQASSTGTSGSTGTATPGRDAAAMRMPAATLNVTALKMVSATCP